MMNFATDTCSGQIILYFYYDGRKVSDFALTLAEAKALCRILGATIENVKGSELQRNPHPHGADSIRFDKVCEWLRTNYEDIGIRWMRGYSAEDLIEQFEKSIIRL